MLSGSSSSSSSRVLAFLFPAGKLEIFVNAQGGKLARQEILSSCAVRVAIVAIESIMV